MFIKQETWQSEGLTRYLAFLINIAKPVKRMLENLGNPPVLPSSHHFSHLSFIFGDRVKNSSIPESVWKISYSSSANQKFGKESFVVTYMS